MNTTQEDDSDAEFYTPECSIASNGAVDSICAHILSLTTIDEQEKQGVLWVLAQSPECSSAKQYLLPAWSEKCLDWHHTNVMAGVNIAKMYPKPPDKMYKARGIGDIPVAPQVILDMITLKELMMKWDPLLLDARHYAGTVCEKEGTARLQTFGLAGVPGFSAIFHNRELYAAATIVSLPNGGFVAHIRAIPETQLPRGSETPPRTVRAVVGDCGWMALPQGTGSHVMLLAQVDPRGWVPTAVVNLVSTLIPMNIDHIRKALKKLQPQYLEQCSIKRRQLFANLPPLM